MLPRSNYTCPSSWAYFFQPARTYGYSERRDLQCEYGRRASSELRSIEGFASAAIEPADEFDIRMIAQRTGKSINLRGDVKSLFKIFSVEPLL
ncbi:hypothetical protein Taro_048136 [Colocasia esculenta]|uniref:Uncharacterized protein n=1 Tax=Colocasia esculenta TaxID=4460 RepID=A0A843X264_COLES|nr:hypothetical protein [Colocasia esculenta]